MPVLQPSQSWSIIPASQLAGITDQKVLLVGQMLAGGTATGGALVQDIANDGSEDTLFARNSHLAGMVREFKKINKVVQLDAIPLDDVGGATQATATLSVGGAISEDTRIVLFIGSAVNHTFNIDVLNGDAAADVAAAMVAAVNADLDAPFTASNALGVVTFTADNGGTLANEWSIGASSTPATEAILSPTVWAGGATDPTLTSIFDVIGDIRYQKIVWPSAYDLTEVETLLNARFNTSYQILDGMAIQTRKGTLAGLKGIATQNSQSVAIFGNKSVPSGLKQGTAVFEMPDIISSEIAAFMTLKLTTDAPLTQYLTTVSSSDQFGSMALASLPYHNTLMPNLPVPSAVDEFTLLEQAELAENGVSLLGPNRAFNGTILGTTVTTYLTDNAGNPDTSFKFIETVETASIIREFFFENCRTKYAQTRLTEGDLIEGRDMANAASIRAFLNELYDELADDTLVQAGTAAKKDFDRNLSITLDLSLGKVTVAMAPLLVTQLRVIIGTIQVNFGS